MNPDEYRRMFELEDGYWWFVGRRNLALRLLGQFLDREEKATVLDLGCGTGAMLSQLVRRFNAVGLDMSQTALQFAKSRQSLALIQGSGTAQPILDRQFDAVVGLDVFEHIEDHQTAFAEAFRALKPGGLLVVSVPAFKSLWGPHDVALHHFRRYRRQELGQILSSTGFEVELLSYSVFFLFPAVLLSRGVEKLKHGPAKASLPKFPAPINRFLIGLQSLEASLLLRSPLPWGSSVVCVARKPDK